MTEKEFIELYLKSDDQKKRMIECLVTAPHSKETLEAIRPYVVTLDCVAYYDVCKALDVPLDYFLKDMEVMPIYKFRGYCIENKIRQKEIAELLNISAQSVSRKMNGKEPFTLDQVKTICVYYGISADEYFV